MLVDRHAAAEHQRLRAATDPRAQGADQHLVGTGLAERLGPDLTATGLGEPERACPLHLGGLLSSGNLNRKVSEHVAPGNSLDTEARWIGFTSDHWPGSPVWWRCSRSSTPLSASAQWAGWPGCGTGTGLAVLLDGALVRHRAPGLGPAGRITAFRAVLACGVAGLTAHSFVADDNAAVVVALATVGLLLDAVDGWVARRTGRSSAFGARFDMEVDAFLIAVLSLYVAPAAGWWVLAIGAIRYVYVAVTWVLPWLRRPLPPRYSAKVVAALQGIVLTVAASALLPLVVIRLALVAALALLVESFAPGRPQAVAGACGAAPATPGPGAGRGRWSGPVSLTGAAFAGLWIALVLPDPTNGLTPGELLRIPLEGLALVAAALVLPGRARRWAAAGFGALAGVLVVLRVVNAGFGVVLDRPFDPLGDWRYFGSGVGVLGDSIGDVGARLAAVGRRPADRRGGRRARLRRRPRRPRRVRPPPPGGSQRRGRRPPPGSCAPRRASTSSAAPRWRQPVRPDSPSTRWTRCATGWRTATTSLRRSRPTGSPTSPLIGC